MSQFDGIYFNPEDAARLPLGEVTGLGLRVETSAFLKPGQAILVNSAALELELSPAEFKLGGFDTLRGDYFEQARASFLAEARATFGLRGRWVLEPDPAERRPTSLRELLCQMGAIVRHDFWKAAGSPRRRWEGPADAFLVTGLAA